MRRLLTILLVLALGLASRAEAASRYWNKQNASANWNATVPTNWGSASNTADNASVPTAADDVFFDGVGGGANNCTITATASARSLNFTGYVGTLTQNTGIALQVGTTTNGPGNIGVLMSAGMTYTPADTTATLTLLSSSATQQTATFNGQAPTRIIIQSGGSWLLGGALVMNASGQLAVNQGTFSTGNFNVTASTLSVTGVLAPTLNLGSSVITLTGAVGWTGFTSAVTMNAGTSLIKFTDTSGTTLPFVGGDRTYYDLWFSRGAGVGAITVSGSNTFHDLKDDGTGTHTMTFPNAGTNHVSTWHVSGTAGHLITVAAASGTTTLTGDVAGTICANYITPTNVTANGTGVSWYAGLNGTDGGGNTGWAFTACPGGSCWRTLLGIGC